MTREQAWTRALNLFDLYIEAATRHNGYGAHRAQDRARSYRVELDALIIEYGFQGTRVDPLTKWTDRHSMPWEAPEVAA